MDFVTKKKPFIQVSTDYCLSYFQDKVAKGFDSGWLTGMIFVDLQKVFNTIDHKILMEKTTCVDFSDDATKWLECYLSRECLM